MSGVRIPDSPPNIGGIAQLVERLHGMQEVSGSIPLTSTIFKKPAFQLAFYYLNISLQFYSKFNANSRLKIFQTAICIERLASQLTVVIFIRQIHIVKLMQLTRLKHHGIIAILLHGTVAVRH